MFSTILITSIRMQLRLKRPGNYVQLHTYCTQRKLSLSDDRKLSKSTLFVVLPVEVTFGTVLYYSLHLIAQWNQIAEISLRLPYDTVFT